MERIQTVDFELDALVHLLESLPEEYEKSYLIESAWKFLIYTEVAKSVYEKLKLKHSYALNTSESSFIELIESKYNIFLKNFSVRLEEELTNISNFGNKDKISNFNVKVSEALYLDVSISIFGREISLNQFQYEYDTENKNKIKVLANKYNSNRFRIHNALLPYLECLFIS
ncbi:hypothetical protein [Nostoc sp.]|uniref:hypothetical protein n=1 Tax=Nostoc sp. TaxID=1180 RepID=UPI002FF74E6D